MSSAGPRLPFLRGRRRAVLTVLVVSLVIAVLLVGAVAVLGIMGTGNADTDTEVPAASFSFVEQNVTVSDYDGEANRTAIEIAYNSGEDVFQGRVIVRVNDQTAWDVREADEGRNATVPVWGERTGHVSDESVRIVVYGNGIGGSDIESEDLTDQYGYLEEGDVVEIVWYDDDGETMTVLQRYVVDGATDED